MKILQINSVCGIGSTGRIATDLYKVLEKQGHECLIAYGRGNAPEGINSIRIGSNLDNYIHVVKTRIFDKHGFASTKATKEFIKKVEEYNPDIIHLHNLHGYYINIEILFRYLKKSNKKVIWTLHDCWAFTGHCSYFDYIGCEKWRSGCENCQQRSGYPKALFLDNSRLNYEKKRKIFTSLENMTIVTPSKWLADIVKKSFLSKYEVNVINNGIDLEIFKPTKSDFREKYRLENKKIILGVASIWDKRKGLDHFIKLSNMLDDNYKIILVGINKNQVEKLPNNIIPICKTNNLNELAQIYTLANVFLNTTLEDNYPTVNLEAISCGTPVITFNSGGSPESVYCKFGTVVNKGDINSVIKELSELNKFEVNKNYAFKVLKSRNSKDKMCRNYYDLYNTIV